MPEKNSVLVVSHPEWLGWITHAELRCTAARISVVGGADDLEGFCRALDRAPFERIADDQALLVAVLSADYLCQVQLMDTATGTDALWLPLRAVAEFVPLSDRGFRLLEGDAERAGCRLSAPRFEELWRCWVDTSMGRFDHQRGLTFSRVLGFDPEPMLSEWCSLIPASLDSSGASGSDTRESYRSTCAYGWAEMLALVSDALGDAGRESIKAIPGVKELLAERKGRFSLGKEDFRAEDALAIASAIEKLYVEVRQEALPSLAVALVCHYRHIKSRDKELDPEVLGTNLGLIRDRYGEGAAALAAYRIGRHMDDHEVYSLLYATRSGEFAALKAPKLPFDPGQLVPAPVEGEAPAEIANTEEPSIDPSPPPENKIVSQTPKTPDVRPEDEAKTVVHEEIKENTAEPDSDNEFVLESPESSEGKRANRRRGPRQAKKKTQQQ